MSFSYVEFGFPLNLNVVIWNEKRKKKYYYHLHAVHQLSHEMKHDNQNASLICPTRIEMLVKVSHNHGMNMRICDNGMSINCSAFWKHHKRPFVVNCSLLDIACCNGVLIP